MTFLQHLNNINIAIMISLRLLCGKFLTLFIFDINMIIGPTTDKIINSIKCELKKKSVQRKIYKDILLPILNNIANKYYYHYLFIISLQIIIVVLLGIIICVFFVKKTKT